MIKVLKNTHREKQKDILKPPHFYTSREKLEKKAIHKYATRYQNIRINFTEAIKRANPHIENIQINNEKGADNKL